MLGEEHMLTEVGLQRTSSGVIADHQVGTMNLFVAFEHSDGTIELVTPPLDDIILPGVTRDR